MRFGGAGGRTWTGGALHREYRTVSGQASQTWKHVVERAHIGGFFLHPDDFGVRVSREFCRKFGVWKWIELFDEHDGNVRDFPFLAFHAKLMSDLTGAEQNAAGFMDFRIRTHAQEIAGRELVDRRRSLR